MKYNLKIAVFFACFNDPGFIIIYTNIISAGMNRIVLISFILLNISLFAQTKVSGVVEDVSKNPVPFANVYFKGSQKGTISDENGQFYLESPEKYDALVISFMGYQNKEITLSKRTTYNLVIVLEEDSESLDEVIVYSGKTSKKDNPALDILREIWKNRRENGVKKFKQYRYDKYEKLEFDINTIDSSLIKSRVFQGVEFIWDHMDTSHVTGKTYLPIFINESLSEVYGDNILGKEKEILQGNKNSGFENNQELIDFVKDIYTEYDIYDNYLKFFDKAFTSPLSRTGIDVYNYVLQDSAFIGDKWCYNIVYYPRRKNELTFMGDFWVNDTTFAIKEINLKASKNANINWVRDVYIEQEYEVLNDSVFLITRDYFMSDFSFMNKEAAQGIYGKRTTLYNNYVFDIEKDRKFYSQRRDPYHYEIFNRPDEFWDEKRMERLSKDERGIYTMLDTLQNLPKFKSYYNLVTTLTSGYYGINGLDVGPIYSIFGYNDAEGLRLRMGARTFFNQNDPWRLEGFGAYGFKDRKFKYGLSAKWLLDRKSRFIIFAGNRHDVEQMGASLTQSDDVLGRNIASSFVLSKGRNDRLSKIDLTTFGFEVEPWYNFVFRMSNSYKTLQSATESFKIDYKVMEDGVFTGEIKDDLKQAEIELAVIYTPGRKTSGYGVEPVVINEGQYPIFYASYGYGNKGLFGSDFDYTKLQFLYSQYWNIGGLGRMRTDIELGKTIGTVPLSLLDAIPGNQTYFSMDNTFSLLDYYEFVSDTYASVHIQHDLGGRIFSRIPLLRQLNLRELLGFRAVYGTISEDNKAINASNLVYQAPEDIYWEWSAGVGNIFKIFRLDFNFRGNYRDVPGVRKFGISGAFGLHF